MTDFRALCEELVDKLHYEATDHRSDELIARARAALAEQPVAPTDEEISDLISRTTPWLRHRHPDHARAVLARWGHPTPQPVPVIERQQEVHPFVVRHYTNDERPSIKGNGFDGLEIGEDRQETEEFIAWINKRICRIPDAVPHD